MQTRPATLTARERTTLGIALTAWIIRCEEEAKTMRQFAKDMPHHAEKCLRNAEASDKLAAEARALSDAHKI